MNLIDARTDSQVMRWCCVPSFGDGRVSRSQHHLFFSHAHILCSQESNVPSAEGVMRSSDLCSKDRRIRALSRSHLATLLNCSSHHHT